MPQRNPAMLLGSRVASPGDAQPGSGLSGEADSRAKADTPAPAGLTGSARKSEVAFAGACQGRTRQRRLDLVPAALGFRAEVASPGGVRVWVKPAHSPGRSLARGGRARRARRRRRTRACLRYRETAVSTSRMRS